MTDGFEVLVQEVIEAITTWPWSSSISWPSRETLVFFDARSATLCTSCGLSVVPLRPSGVGASLAGKLPVTAGSTSSSSTSA